jgi:alpha-tubulin suppressor-like RCC1 family protein
MMQNRNRVRTFPSTWLPSYPETFSSVLIKGLEDKKIVKIACGQQHSIALDSEG